MFQFLKSNYIFYLLFIPVFIGSAFVVSSAPLAVGGLGIAWFIIKKRYDYLVLIFFLTLILANNRAPVLYSYKLLRIALILILSALSAIIIFKEKGIDQRIIYFLPFFVISFTSSFLFSPTMLSSVFKVFSYLVLVLAIFVLIRHQLQDADFNLYEQLLLIFGLSFFISLIGAAVYPAIFLRSGRLQGFLGNPDFLSLFCVVTYAYADHFRVEDSKLSRRDIFIIKALIIVALFLTGSRNGYLSLAIYIILTTFIFRGISGRTIAVLAVLSAGFLIFEIRALTDLLPFLKHYIRPDSLSTGSGRSVVWPVAIDEIYRQPWLGGGFAYYSYYMANFAVAHGLQGVYWYGVWNSYLALLLDTGIIGLLAYIYFVYGVVRNSIRFIIVLPFLSAMMFTGMFEAWASSSLNPITPFFLLIFVIISINGSRYENFSLA